MVDGVASDGTMLVTERGGRLRAVRNWQLDPTPVAGVPQVQAGGLQGLMDVVVHPRFAENRYVYLSYHKPVAVMGADGKPAVGRGGAPQMAGATTIARGTWNGTALVDVKDIWHDPQAVRTESSRIGFGRDGMLYMSVSASGTGPDVLRSADPSDIAGKTIRCATTARCRRTTRFTTSPDTRRRSTRSATATGTRCSSIRTPRVLGHRTGSQRR
jgi:glucose/arabinose dehydrogenase